MARGRLGLLDVRCFDAVVREGSFRRAASALHLSQPAVSVHVKKLEQSLGTQLLRRTTRGSTLTDAGTAMLPHLRSLLRAEESTQQHAAAVAGRRFGRVRVAAVNSALTGLLPEAVRMVQSDHSAFEVEVAELTSKAVADGVHDGTFDIGLAAHPVDASPQLRVETLARSGLMLVAHEDHPLLHGLPVTREIVASEPFVTLQPGYTLRDLATEYLRPYPLRIAGEALNHDTVRRLVAARLGVTIMPNMTFEIVGKGQGLGAVPLADSDDIIQLSMLHPGDLAAPATRAVSSAIRRVARRRFGSTAAASAHQPLREHSPPRRERPA
ncbi:MAG: LysR family transcriptional regulator [Acidimicrobiales bacterium]|nr:LysR family transcriptional regulator [Acidimicrobiales bacterium]MXY01312.1 LysR family transcriptional regulator [Acidimicrobiales bacterium]MYA27044.1 LysR family transcriptional regulator [Acidimicrobiales bacterium]MYA83489.1 LysR family transcriptional regulator [Acidimicrobiales bacterium]MYD34188.1 LysR family transcriptional regulator [Acidimicrobiales bacterium]